MQHTWCIWCQNGSRSENLAKSYTFEAGVAMLNTLYYHMPLNGDNPNSGKRSRKEMDSDSEMK